MSSDPRPLSPSVLREFNDRLEPACGFKKVFRGSCASSEGSRTEVEVASLRSMCRSGAGAGAGAGSICSVVSSFLDLIGQPLDGEADEEDVGAWLSREFELENGAGADAVVGVGVSKATVVSAYKTIDLCQSESSSESESESNSVTFVSSLPPAKTLKRPRAVVPRGGSKKRLLRRADVSLRSVWGNADDEWGY